MSNSKTKRRIWIVLSVIVILIAAAGLYFFKFATNYPFKNDLVHRPDFFGVTFSKKYCGEIGLDWKETYDAILSDLKVKEIRLPIYWDEIEPSDGVFNFSDYDYIINEGAKQNVKFIVNIGWRLPRWPECHAPDWATEKSLATTQAKAIKMLAAVVDHYKNNPAVTTWQLENEPFFDAFGLCPPADANFFQLELATVKQHDSRPVLISASGELSWWRKEAQLADIFGTTVYRVVSGQLSGYLRYPIPAWFYRLKAYLVGIKPANRVIMGAPGRALGAARQHYLLADRRGQQVF